MENEKKKKKRKKIIILALLATVCSGFALATSTYAWFTANRTVTVSDVNVNVAAADGLQISVDGLNWKTVIANSDITGASSTYSSATNQLPTGANTLSPVSTIGAIDSSTGFMDMFAGTIEGSSLGTLILTTAKSTETNGVTGDFVAFDIFFQVNSVTPIFLTSNSKVTVSTGQTSTGIENAARVAFIDEGNSPSGSSAATIQGMKAGSTPIIWEPNYDVHTPAAISNALSNYNITTAETGASQISYYGVKAEIPLANEVALNSTDSAYFSAVTPTISTAVAGISESAYESLLTLQPGITKVRIYMWVEGQDVDCEDNASGGSITYSLQFSTNSSVSGS